MIKINKFCIILLSLVILLSSCGTFQEGMSGTKRSKSSDEFLVYKKKPLVVPPDFDDIPSPKPVKKEEKKLSASNTSIEDLLNIEKKVEDTFETKGNNSLEQSILKKIKQN